MEYLEESGMQFYLDEECWVPEKTNCFEKWQHVKACDLVKKHSSKLCFIEAKSSAPKDDKLQAYCQDIVLKFENTLLFFLALYVDRLKEEQEPLPTSLKNNELIKKGVHILVLIIKKHPKHSLIDLSYYFDKNKIIIRLKRILKINQVVCLNEETAKKKGFVI